MVHRTMKKNQISLLKYVEETNDGKKKKKKL